MNQFEFPFLKHPEDVTGMRTDHLNTTRHALIQMASDPESMLDGGAPAYLRLCLLCIAGMVFTNSLIRAALPDHLPDTVRDELNVQFRHLDQLTEAVRKGEPFALLAAEYDEERDRRMVVQDFANNLVGGFLVAVNEHRLEVSDGDLLRRVVDAAAAEVDGPITDAGLATLTAEIRNYVNGGALGLDDVQAAARHATWAYLSWRAYAGASSDRQAAHELLDMIYVLMANLTCVSRIDPEWTPEHPYSFTAPFDFDANILR